MLVDEIVKLRKMGYAINDIVKSLNCAKSTVSYHINKVGLGGVRNPFIADIDDKLIEKIKEFRVGLKTYKEIQILLDINKDKLIKICRLYNINKSSKTFKKKELDKSNVIELYLKNKSIKLTAKQLGCDKTIVRRYIPDELIRKKGIDKISNSKNVINWRKRTKLKLVEYKGGKCVKCDYNKCLDVLQFHHINPKEKDFNIGRKSYSLERLKKEVDKCMLVCANCHIEIHEKIRSGSSEAEQGPVKA